MKIYDETLKHSSYKTTMFADTKSQIKNYIKIKWPSHWVEQTTKLKEIKELYFTG